MSEFDKQNEDVFQIVHDNPRRRGVTRTVGFIVNQKQAEQFAAFEAIQQRNVRYGHITMFMALIIVVIGVAIATLVG